MIEPFKYMLQPVALERDERGRIIRELPGQVLTVFDAEQAVLAINEFEKLISQNGASPREEESMPVAQETVVNITCDNPACPGNALDPAERTGWTFVNTEVYGQPGLQHVYCCADCAGAVSDTLREAEGAVQE